MALTGRDIENVVLSMVKYGYDPEEVDLLLERIAKEVDALNQALIAAEDRARIAELRVSQSN